MSKFNRLLKFLVINRQIQVAGCEVLHTEPAILYLPTNNWNIQLNSGVF